MGGDALDSFGAEKYFGIGVRGVFAVFTAAILFQRGAKFARTRFRANRNYLRPIFSNLLRNERNILARGEGYDLKLPWERINHLGGLAPDGTGGTQYRDLFHVGLFYGCSRKYANERVVIFRTIAHADKRLD